jgi:hypothetical protein
MQSSLCYVEGSVFDSGACRQPPVCCCCCHCCWCCCCYQATATAAQHALHFVCRLNADSLKWGAESAAAAAAFISRANTHTC